MDKIKVAVVGYGNIGKYVVEALETAPDFEIAGIVRRNAANVPDEIKRYKVSERLSELPDPLHPHPQCQTIRYRSVKSWHQYRR